MELCKLNKKQVDRLIQDITLEEYQSYIPKLLLDPRQTIKKIGISLQEKVHKHEEEIIRVKGLWRFEEELFSNGIKMIAGIDEVGRGPLAGPVVAAAVILPEGIFIEGINDSKKVNKLRREAIYNVIMKEALGVGIGIVENDIIDEINILNATKLAMKEAVKKLPCVPQYLLIDALELDDIAIKQKGIVGGDGKSISIAAASIVAKVTRDQIMERYDSSYPEYKFSVHKGYGTAEHYGILRLNGITSIHRKSFLKKLGDEWNANT